MGEKNFNTIFEEIRHFINPTNEPDFPLLYTMSDHISCVDSILKQLAVEICHDETEASEMFTVCSIDDLFFQLKKNTPKPLPSHFVAKILLDKDHYEHSPGLACNFHDEEDIPKYCALAMVIRWAFTVCDNICGSLDITLIPGKHVPMRSDVNYRPVEPEEKKYQTNENTGGNENNFIPNKNSEICDYERPDIYETVYVNGIPSLQLKEETPIMVENPYARHAQSSKDVKDEESEKKESSSEDEEKPVISFMEENIRETVLMENPLALSKFQESDYLQEDRKNPEVKPVLDKDETLVEVKPILIKQEPEEQEFTYCGASVTSQIVENPFARKERTVDPNSFYGLVKQLKKIHEESDEDDSDGVPGSIVYEDRIGQTKMKRRLLADGTGAVKKDPSSVKNRYLVFG